jgi:aspartate kinase
MKILKFGGTSVGKPERMHAVAQLIQVEATIQRIVVLSALSGTTNALVSINESLSQRKKQDAFEKIEQLFAHYKNFIQDLYTNTQGLERGNAIIEEHFTFMQKIAEKSLFTFKEEKMLLAEGELLSTQLFHAYLESQNINAILLPALDFMFIDKDGEPDFSKIKTNLQNILKNHKEEMLFVTQGYICKNSVGEIDNLKRGGSDYSASIIGAVVQAQEIQIWTDIDGMHNNDPRIVKRTFPVAELSFDEAAELAYFGAKILHPSSINPARQYNIPVRLLNTMQPEARGTLISNQISINPEKPFKAIAAKDGITAINIKSSRMLLAYGFLRKIFEVFEKFKVSIDMITTSEVGVSLTIDDTTHIKEMANVLKFFGNVETDTDQTIICIVGDFVSDHPALAMRIFTALQSVNVRMISFGGSKHNISLLVATKDKENALNLLNEGLFF